MSRNQHSDWKYKLQLFKGNHTVYYAASEARACWGHLEGFGANSMGAVGERYETEMKKKRGREAQQCRCWRTDSVKPPWRQLNTSYVWQNLFINTCTVTTNAYCGGMMLSFGPNVIVDVVLYLCFLITDVINMWRSYVTHVMRHILIGRMHKGTL